MTLLRTIITTASAIAMMFVASQATASESAIQKNTGSRFMAVYNETLPPIGFVQFCKFTPEDCGGTMGEAVRVVMNADRWNDLTTINDFANRTVEPVSDMDLYNVVEYWTYPKNQGDCEDYVLLKRKKLMMMGWPAEALLITVLRDENNEGHAVLTVSTDQGDFILDNRVDEILSWKDTEYTYYKRQSQSDPRRWVSLRPDTSTGQMSNVAGLSAKSAQ